MRPPGGARAQAAPTQPGEQPQQLGSSPWPEKREKGDEPACFPLWFPLWFCYGSANPLWLDSP